MLQTQSDGQYEKNPGASPSEGENRDDCHPHQPLTIPQQCKEDQSGSKTEVYYENQLFPWRCNITASTAVVPFQAGVAAVNIPPHPGFISIGPSPDCVQAALPHSIHLNTSFFNDAVKTHQG
ncbi:hypothetical protein J4Q44_G00336610 [Coregonus suidteri]|uniref:Uncharacterized protein n=1 Tax=Coregonus suidteri TaxID=861788 RepID=A0AAN8KQX8_9TELE